MLRKEDNKICTICKIEKPLECFGKSKKTKSGRRSDCKDCRKEYRKKNKEKIKQGNHKYRKENRSTIIEKNKEYYSKNKVAIDIKNKEYREKNKEKVKKLQKEYYEKNKKTILEKNRKYRETRKEEARVYHKGYRERNKDKIVERQRDWSRKQSANNIQFKIKKNIRERIRSVIRKRGIEKPVSSIVALGCNLDFFVRYFKDKFYYHPKTGEIMSWDNYGDWHIDHIMPLASFDLSDKKQFLEACHYTNLQPLWAEENLRKSSKII